MSPLSSPLFLCVDCGGTKTAAVICSADGTIIGRGTAGPSNIAYLPLPAFLRAVTDAILRALADAKHPLASSPLPPPSSSTDTASSPFPSAPFHSAWFGISGADSPSAIRAVTPALAALLHLPLDPASPTGTSPRLAVANDTHLLAAPVHGFPADGPHRVTHVVAVIGGTGSIAVSFARGTGEGGELTELARVGGWGWILGDEGGGYDVGREALRQILSASDHAQIVRANAGLSATTTIATSANDTPTLYPTAFTSRVLARFGVSPSGGALDVFGGVYASDPPPSPPNPAASPSPPTEPPESSKKTLTPPPDDLPSYLSMPREKRLSSLPPLVFAAAFPHAHAHSQDQESAAPDPLALNILRTCAAKLGAQAAALFGLPSPANAHLPPPVQGPVPAGTGTGAEPHTPPTTTTTTTTTTTPILDPRRTLLTFGGSLVGVPAYRALVVADLAARFRAHRAAAAGGDGGGAGGGDGGAGGDGGGAGGGDGGAGEGDGGAGEGDVESESEGRMGDVLFPLERVVFVDDAAAAGARGLASAWRRENGRV